jgi:outer membrane protein OmpA-like peptidoglycan-associated protein
MLRRRLAACLIALLTLSAAGSSAVRAQDEPDGELGFLVGASRADNALTAGGNRIGPLLGLRVASRIREDWNWFADGVHSSYDHGSSIDPLRLLEARTGFEYLFGHQPEGMHWFLSGALGLASVKQPSGFDDEGGALGSLGIGWAQLTTRGGPRIEVRGERILREGSDRSNVQLVLGWSLGLRAAGAEPPRDSDGDGVYDDLDRCPDTPRGTVVDAYGCPERKTMFEPGKKTLVLEGVNFALDSAELTPESYQTLDRVVGELTEWPEVRVEIGGHTDWTGEDAYNMDLSQRRTESVKAYLASKGIAESRLEAKGYGESQPIADNGTEAGRAKNRRVELKKLD